MSERKGLIERTRDAGQAVIAISALAAGLGAISVKAIGWANSGPIALTKAERLEKDVRRLKRQSRFTVKVLEKIGKEKYDWTREDREISSEDSDEQR